jgi:hypothetical protein
MPRSLSVSAKVAVGIRWGDSRYGFRFPCPLMAFHHLFMLLLATLLILSCLQCPSDLLQGATNTLGRHDALNVVGGLSDDIGLVIDRNLHFLAALHGHAAPDAVVALLERSDALEVAVGDGAILCQVLGESCWHPSVARQRPRPVR